MQTTRFSYLAAQQPNQIAVTETGRGRVWTRGDLAGCANRLSRALRAAGLRPGDCLVIVAPNCGEFLAAYLAATQIGLYFVPVNWHASPGEIVHVLRTCRARALLIHSRFAGLLASLAEADAVPPLCLSIGAVPPAQDIAEYLTSYSVDPIEDPIQGRIMFFTGATTGLAKAVRFGLANAAASLDRYLQAFIEMNAGFGIGVNCDSVHLCQSMLYHGAPLLRVISALHLGHPVLLMDTWDPQVALRLIETNRVQTTFMVPSMFVRVLKLAPEIRRSFDLRSLRIVFHGGAPCAAEIKRQMMDWWGPILYEMYGASEGTGTRVTAQEWLEHPGTVGRPFPGIDLRILDEAGQPVPTGTVGTVYLKMRDPFEYVDDPQKTQAARCGDYFTAGDLGYVDAEGYLYLCDRRSNLVLSGGANIYPAEVEQVLLTHPAVADCVVVGIPDVLLGQALKAFIEPMQGVQAGSGLSLDILKFAGQHLAVGKVPRRIEYVSRIPRDPSGKLTASQRQQLVGAG